ncbi:protein Yop1p [[Candida] anglica]|uniref:Protein YOP1 n=1 Tax=[Candida] anglica TaxID=148631 RepID=A0ABP0EH02_9ASCO
MSLDQAKLFLSHIDKKSAGVTLLGHFEKNTGLPRSYAVLSATAVYMVLIFINVGGIGELLSNIAGFVVPAYYSLHALSTASTKDDTQLLTYWVVFAFLNVIEFWSKAILYWIPFYFLFKTIFLIYIAVPQFGGAELVFQSVIKPIADTHIVGKSISKDVSDAASGVSSSVHI